MNFINTTNFVTCQVCMYLYLYLLILGWMVLQWQETSSWSSLPNVPWFWNCDLGYFVLLRGELWRVWVPCCQQNWSGFNQSNTEVCLKSKSHLGLSVTKGKMSLLLSCSWEHGKWSENSPWERIGNCGSYTS